MNSIYNGKFTLINGTDDNIVIPSDFIQFKLNDKTLLDIKNQEVYSHKLFNGHVIIKKNYEIDLEKIKNLDLSQNKVYCKSVFHSGIYTDCIIDSSLVICNSWMLPFVLDPKCDYSYLRKHRAKLFNFNIKTLS